MDVPNKPDPLNIARRIIEIPAVMDEYVRAGRYEKAARARDERAALEKQLGALAGKTLVRNVQIAMGRVRAPPVVRHLTSDDSIVDGYLLEKLRIVSTPVRLAIQNLEQPCVGTLRKLLDAESLESRYYEACFPLFSAETVTRATHPMQWIEVVKRETAATPIAVILIICDLNRLEEIGIFDRMVEHLAEPSIEFVTCVSLDNSPRARRIARLSCVQEIVA